MKLFIALFAIAAVAVAEPEADAEAYYSRLGFGYGAGHLGYSGVGYSSLGYSGYGGYAHSAYAGYTPYAFGARAYGGYASSPFYGNYASHGRFFAKREADAEADPAVFYGGLGFGYGASPYTVGAYNGFNGYNRFYNNYAYASATPFAHATYAHQGLPYAHAAYAHHAIHPATHVTQANGPVSSTAAIHSGNGIPGAYANAGNYVANSAGVVHVAKREAEAEPEAYYAGLGYAYGAPHALTYGARSYAAYSPYTAYNGYRNLGYGIHNRGFYGNRAYAGRYFF